jgi:TatD DNase family protein
LLVETDAPYLAPVPHRGRRNEPAFVRQVADGLARARGLDAAALDPQLHDNARRVFGPAVDVTL